MSGEHKVLGEEIQSYSHSDPNLIRQPLTRSLVTKISWSPDGARLASLADSSNELILWDAIAGAPIRKLDLRYPSLQWPHVLAFTADGKSLVTFGLPDAPKHDRLESFSLVDAQTGGNQQYIAGPLVDGKPSRLTAVAVPKDGSLVAMLFSSVTGQSLFLYDAATRQPMEAVFARVGLRVPEYEHDMALSADGQQVAMLKTLSREVPLRNDPTRTMSDNFYQIDLWNVAERRVTSSKEINRQDWSSSWPSMIRFSPDGRFIAVGMDNEDHRPVRVLDAASGSEVHAYESPRGEKGWPVWGSIHGLDWSPDGRLIAFCGEDKSLHILDAHSTSVLDKVTAPGACWAAAFSPDGSRIAYGADHTVIVRKILPRS
jgi:WD40 repeat protein